MIKRRGVGYVARMKHFTNPHILARETAGNSMLWISSRKYDNIKMDRKDMFYEIGFWRRMARISITVGLLCARQ